MRGISVFIAADQGSYNETCLCIKAATDTSKCGPYTLMVFICRLINMKNIDLRIYKI